MRTLFLILLLTLTLMLTGCSTNVARSDDGSQAEELQAEELQAGDLLLTEPATITVTLTDDAREQNARKLGKMDIRIDPDRLRETLIYALDIKGLLADDTVMPSYHVNVEITELNVNIRNSLYNSAFMKKDVDRLKGRVTLSDADHRPIRSFGISAANNCTGQLENDARAAWLYEQLAKGMLDGLTGRDESTGLPEKCKMNFSFGIGVRVK